MLDSEFILKTLAGDDAAKLDAIDIKDPNANLLEAQRIYKEEAASPSGRARLALAAGFAEEPTWDEKTADPPPVTDTDARVSGMLAQYWENGIPFGFAARAELEKRAGGNPSSNTGESYLSAFRALPQRDTIVAAYKEAGLDLEADLRAAFGVEYAVATSSGFAAIHLAASALIAGGGPALVPAMSTCNSIPEAIRAAGAAPLFIQNEAEGYGICPEAARRHASGAVLAVVPHHFGDMVDLADFSGLQCPVLEDASQAFYSVFARNRAPSTRALVLSFSATKGFTAPSGGALLTNDQDLACAVRTRRSALEEYVTGGMNYEMPNLIAAMIRASLQEVPARAARLAEHDAQYRRAMADFRGARYLSPRQGSVLQRAILRFEDASHRDPFIAALKRSGIAADAPMLDLRSDDHGASGIVTETIAKTVRIPLFPDLTADEILTVTRTVRTVLGAMGI